MANVGARYAKWAPVTAEPSASLPQYGDVVNLGALVSVNDTPNFNEAKQYGDDHAVNVLYEFKDCDLDCEVTEMATQTAAKLYGETFTPGQTSAPGTKTSKQDDSAPYGGFGFIRATYENNAYGYVGVYYPKAKAVPQGATYTTKGDSIVFTGDKFKMKAIACANGVWREESEPFTSESAAQAWVDALVVKHVT